MRASSIDAFLCCASGGGASLAGASLAGLVAIAAWTSTACAQPRPLRDDSIRTELIAGVNDAADQLASMLSSLHDARSSERVLARKLSVEAALLPALVLQDLAHGCARPDLGSALAYAFASDGVPPSRALGVTGVCAEPGWDCGDGAVWWVRATTERLRSAGPEPAVAIEWVIESDGVRTRAVAERFEPSLAPAELDMPLLPWDLVLGWDARGAHALDRTGLHHEEQWAGTAPVFMNPEDMVDTFDIVRVQQWLARRRCVGLDRPRWWRPGALRCDRSADPQGETRVELDRGPLHWHDPHAYTVLRQIGAATVSTPFRPSRMIAPLPSLHATIQWRPPAPGDRWEGEGPARVPARIDVWSEGTPEAAIRFGPFTRGRPIARAHEEQPPPWDAFMAAIARHDEVQALALLLAAQDRLGPLVARERMGVELAVQALDTAVEAGWTLERVRALVRDPLQRSLDRMPPPQLLQLVLEAVRASRLSLALVAAERLMAHPSASVDQRTWAQQSAPHLWAWMHRAPTDETPLAERRVASDRVLRMIVTDGTPQSPPQAASAEARQVQR